MRCDGGAMAWCRLTRISFLLVVPAAMFLSGCGAPKPPKPVPVKGTVTFRGKPLANARVSFYGPKASLPATGDTNEKGEFVLSMYGKDDGALVGEDKVTVSSLSKDSGNAPPDATKIASGGGNPSATAKIARGGGDTIPKVYADSANTTLTWTVKAEGETDAKIELK